VKVLEITNLVLKESPVLYRREFTADAIFETLDKEKLGKKIEFVLEKNHFGDSEIRVSLLEDINFPLVSIIRRIKNHIHEMDQKGLLP
jgi:hypothetical protein